MSLAWPFHPSHPGCPVWIVIRATTHREPSPPEPPVFFRGGIEWDPTCQDAFAAWNQTQDVREAAQFYHRADAQIVANWFCGKPLALNGAAAALDSLPELEQHTTSLLFRGNVEWKDRIR